MSNPQNQHTALFTSKKGAVTGCTVKSNHNVQRGGGYGFNPKGKPGFGVMPIETYPGCGVTKQPNLNTATQTVGSPNPPRPGLPQRGGGVAKSAGRIVNMKADATAGACKNCGGTPYYGYAKAIPGINNYPTYTPQCHPMCGGPQAGGSRRRRKSGGRRRTRRGGKRRASRGGKRRTRRGGNRRTRRGRRRTRQRGGYAQFGSDIPSTPGYATPNGGNWTTANPPTFARINACGTGSCVDNYNHFTGKGAPAPVLDAGVTPPPPVTVIAAPKAQPQCGGRRKRHRKKRRTRRKHRSKAWRLLQYEKFRRKERHRRKLRTHRRRRGALRLFTKPCVGFGCAFKKKNRGLL